MGDVEADSNPVTPRTSSPAATARLTPPVTAPPLQFHHSPSLTRSPLLSPDDHIEPAVPSKKTSTNTTPRIRTPRFITPIGSPIKKVLQLTKLDPQDAWLPITQSRNGNAYYAAFHCLCSGIGVQALILPVAFTVLGWSWGVILLTAAFIWQLYTLYILVQLHESFESGARYSRYLELAYETFGEKLSRWVVLFPYMYLSIGTASTLIIIGASSSKMFFRTVCGETCADRLTTVEWYVVFTVAAMLLSQMPNLNSVAGFSLIGAITAVGYCTLIWVISVVEGRVPGVSYDPVLGATETIRIFDVLNAIGIIAFAFRGHNLILEIQATMPSSEKHPSRVPMWRGVKAAYTLIAICLYPLAIAGYWAYGQRIPSGGMLAALFKFHGSNTSRLILAVTSSFIVINAVTSFQIYGMPLYDFMESLYTSRKKKPCPFWIRLFIRLQFGLGGFLPAVAIPFLSSFGGLIGGIALPVTFSYPCFMWLQVKKPKMYSPMWFLNWVLGITGLVLSALAAIAGVYKVIKTGIQVSFFKPRDDF